MLSDFLFLFFYFSDIYLYTWQKKIWRPKLEWKLSGNEWTLVKDTVSACKMYF